jgi:8-oxo-dGTP pyrophosphatase MutT (NUDIX family)
VKQAGKRDPHPCNNTPTLIEARSLNPVTGMKPKIIDPTLAQIDALAGEPPVPASQLEPGWLRERFRTPVAWLPEFGDEEEKHFSDRPPVPAAVLVPLVVRDQGLQMLLTMRTAHLHDHAGQISFPGGRVDPDDEDAIATALRETEEEIGLSHRHIEVIGHLPDYQTGTGFKVTPVVALVHPPFELAADEFEVAEIFEVPLSFLMDGANHQRRSAEFPNRPGRRSFYAMPWERYFIWGATAAMLRNLYHFLRADDAGRE